VAVIYFLTLLVFGNIILLNLFLAVLLGNFVTDPKDIAEADAPRVERARKKAMTSIVPDENLVCVINPQSSPMASDGFSSSSPLQSQGTFDNQSIDSQIVSVDFFYTNEETGAKAIWLTSVKKWVRIDGASLCLFVPKHFVRKFCVDVVTHRYFDPIILALIVASSILLAIDNPLDDPESEKVKTLAILDIIITACFIVECVLKIIAYGFLCNRQSSYLRSGWNVLDF
jgi:hypothetical protein